jgi:hypothetical protein
LAAGILLASQKPWGADGGGGAPPGGFWLLELVPALEQPASRTTAEKRAVDKAFDRGFVKVSSGSDCFVQIQIETFRRFLSGDGVH